MLTWDDSYPLALQLKNLNPNICLADVSLEMIYHWIIAMPDFVDDPGLANDEILSAIYQEWFEEANPL
jgi:FeS assembly protein IscX